MAKIKQFVNDLSLKKSIVLYIAVFAIIAILLSAVTSVLCNNAINKIEDKYPNTGEKYYLTNENGERLGDGTYISNAETSLSKEDERLTSVLEMLATLAAPVYSALCVVAAAWLFYHNKMKEPIEKLLDASEKISNNDLDFQIDYHSKDEFGQLCTSFEVMRSTLADNFSEMWRQMEERQQLNAAFAHDLRTPLTVLKGYNEILQSSNDFATRDTAVTMEKHIFRLERYVDSMSHLRRLEDTQPEIEAVDVKDYIETLADSAKILCAQYNKNLSVKSNIKDASICFDCSFVSQVNNNLISNALRYAKSNIHLHYLSDRNGFYVSVSDDGCGFTNEVLSKAANPYFTEEKDHCEHFGLGLYISKILCEHHGGWLKIKNCSTGAKVTTFFKTLDL